MADPTREFEHGYTCKEVVELATQYADGVMPASQMTQFEMHLNFCDGCYTFVDQIRSTAAMAGRLSEEQIPESTKAKLLAAFRDWNRT
jgi:anti-sigma factor ChrR (cupin superfamily)